MRHGLMPNRTWVVPQGMVGMVNGDAGGIVTKMASMEHDRRDAQPYTMRSHERILAIKAC